MNKCLTLLILACAFSLGACGGESSFPEATGKASVRAINAMQTSPEVAFLIEERSIGQIGYKAFSPTSEYDDLTYRFNFEVLFVGDTDNTRFAGQQLDVVADRDYTFLLTGSVTAPTITLFESAERTFSGSETVFQTRFLHAAESFGAVDIYLAAPGVAPAVGAEQASLVSAQMSDPIDFSAGEFVLTITAPGDPTTVVYQSSTITIGAENDVIISLFDGDVDDSSPLVVLGSGTSGALFGLPDPSFLPTVEFLHAASDLGSVDIYDDEALTSQIVAGLDFKQLSPAQDVAVGDTTYRFTPAGDTATVSVEQTLSAIAGVRYRIVALGTDGTYIGSPVILDRRPIDTAAKLLIFQSTTDIPFLDYYLAPAGEGIDGLLAFRGQVASGLQNAPFGIAPGSYDLYATSSGTTDIVGGPLRLDAALGDVFELMAYDTVDPAQVELEFLTTP